MGVAVLFLMAATYFIGVGIFSLLTSMHAWLGLRGGVENASRGLHITQLVLGIPGILLGVAVIEPSVASGIARFSFGVTAVLGFSLIIYLATHGYDRAIMLIHVVAFAAMIAGLLGASAG